MGTATSSSTRAGTTSRSYVWDIRSLFERMRITMSEGSYSQTTPHTTILRLVARPTSVNRVDNPPQGGSSLFSVGYSA